MKSLKINLIVKVLYVDRQMDMDRNGLARSHIWKIFCVNALET
jgi:hypothetical protein